MNLLFSAANIAARMLYDNQTLVLYENGVVDKQFSSPRQIRCCPPGSPLAGKLLVADGGNNRYMFRGSDLAFYTKYLNTGLGGSIAIDADANNIYTGSNTTYNTLSKRDYTFASLASLVIANIRMIDASGDPDYIYFTSNNATDGHQVRKVQKSTMSVVAQNTVADGVTGWKDPLGVLCVGNFVYVCDQAGSSGNYRVVALNKSDLTYASTPIGTLTYVPLDIATNGTSWYILNASRLYKFDAAWSHESYVSVNVGYSITYIPDQGDGNGATLAITDNTNSHLARYKCSDLSQVGSDVGSSGTGADTICDPQVTGPAGIWFDSEGGNYAVASAANISKNDFSGDFFRGTGNVLKYRPTTGGLAAITAIDFNDDKISGPIKNLEKCVNLTSCKLQTNPSLQLDLGRLSAKLVTLWAYACGAGIIGSIRYMTAATSINLRENGASQAQVDQWIGELYANKDVMAPGTANFNGTNAAPSAAGKAQADELVNDYGWTIAYTV